VTTVGVAGHHDGASTRYGSPEPYRDEFERVGVAELVAGASWRPYREARPALPRAYDPPSPRSWAFDPHEIRATYRHLSKRFFWSLRPGRPSEASMAWAESVLTDVERRFLHEMSPADQRHGIGVGRLAARVSGESVVGRAGLLHDVGKIDCRLGPLGRAVATYLRRCLPATADHLSRQWLQRVRQAPDARLKPRTWRERFAAYWMHPWTGRLMLERAGVDPKVAAWAEHHHHCYIGEDLLFDWADATLLWELDGD